MKLSFRKGVRAAGWLALIILVSGCQTPFRTVDERFMSRPGAYQQVQVLPIWLAGAGDTDHSLTTNDVLALRQQTGETLAKTVRQTLRSKGYNVAGPVLILSSSNLASHLDAETREQLETVRIDFYEKLLRPWAQATSDKPLVFRASSAANPFHCRLTPVLTNVAVRLGVTNAAAVLLVDSKVFFESRHKQARRMVWNWTGGGLLAVSEVGANLAILAAAALAGADSAPVPVWVDPFWHSSNSIQHSIALVDLKTQEVLWFNRQDFRPKNPGDQEIFSASVADVLADLP